MADESHSIVPSTNVAGPVRKPVTLRDNHLTVVASQAKVILGGSSSRKTKVLRYMR